MARSKKPAIPGHWVIDFETLKIQDRPVYPPVPVGVSIIAPGKKKGRYYAWGHLNGNNCSWGEAYRALKEAWDSDARLIFQNAKFDLDVAEEHMGLPLPPWDRVEDTMLLLFLDDPHQQELGLKQSAERLLDEPPEEQDALIEWLITNQPVPGLRVNKSKNGKNYAGAYIAYAPGDIVGAYADGDTGRTKRLFELLYPKTLERQMGGAYDRERRLLPILLRMERRGIRADLARLEADIERYGLIQQILDAYIRKRLKAPDLNIDSGDDLMAAMLAAGVAKEELAHVTAGGKLSTSKDSLMDAVADKSFLAVMRYRAALKTCKGTFMEPWRDEARASGGLISTSWNQVRSPAGGGNVGTRTGRLSASRFMNMPKEFNAIWAHEEPDPVKAKKLPKCPIKDLPSLPWVRSYIMPFEGHVLIDRDYSQQEPRILAHFDGGELMDTYIENPWIDFHDYAKAGLAEFGLIYDRKPVKTFNLGLIYGMGAPLLGAKTDMPVEEAKKVKDALLKLYPGLAAMYKDMKARYKAGLPIRTWGGREYYCEPPKLKDGCVMHFDYKMVNLLIQGSAADCTKEAVIRWDDALEKIEQEAGTRPDWHLILTVHDQLTASAPAADDEWILAMALLNQVMESVEFDVPMLSEGAYSFTNWAELKPYDTKGKQVYVQA